MQLARVVGTAISTKKHPSLAGEKLLVLQPLLAGGCGPDGDPVLAIDRLGSGTGELVMFTSDGPTTREMIGDESSPARYCVIGICDE